MPGRITWLSSASRPPGPGPLSPRSAGPPRVPLCGSAKISTWRSSTASLISSPSEATKSAAIPASSMPGEGTSTRNPCTARSPPLLVRGAAAASAGGGLPGARVAGRGRRRRPGRVGAGQPGEGGGGRGGKPPIVRVNQRGTGHGRSSSSRAGLRVLPWAYGLRCGWPRPPACQLRSRGEPGVRARCLQQVASGRTGVVWCGQGRTGR